MTVWMKFTAIVTSTINAITSVSATLGNTLIIYVVLKYKKLRNPSNLLLGSLSITDFLVGLIVQPLSVVRRTLNIHSIHICIIRLLFSFFGFLCSGASLINISLISVDRCLAILFPFRYEELAENRKYCCIIATTWMAWALTNVLYKLKVLSLSKFFIGVITIYGITITIVIISYSLIHRVILRLRRKTLPIQTINEQNRKKKQLKHHHMAKTVAITIGVLLICYLPKLTVALIRITVGVSANLVNIGDAWADMFVLVNSSLNPLIYCYRMKDIRQAMLDTIWTKILHRERNSKTQPITKTNPKTKS